MECLMTLEETDRSSANREPTAEVPRGVGSGAGKPVMADLITGNLSVRTGTPIAKVVRLFEEHPEADVIAVLAEESARAAVRNRFFHQLGQRFGYSLYENRPIDLLAEDVSTVDADSDPLEVIALAMQREPGRVYDDILVLSAGRFLGTVSMRSLLVHHKELLARSMAAVGALDEKNRQLGELNRIQAEFAANMTHELRSPINMVLGIASMLLGDEQLTESQRRHLRLLIARGQELLGIVNNMLDLARLEAGALEPVIEEVELTPLFDDLAQSAEPMLEGKLVRLQVDFRSLPRTFATDPVFLRRILTNLLSNAIKFTDLGLVTLAAERSGSALLLRVSDTGVGIREEDQQRLFSKFTQLESTKTKRHKGTGLGLAIVKALVGQLGGTIGVESQVGTGSTFSVRLESGGARRDGMEKRRVH
jgi:signal transduction histidine kinase